MLKTKRQSASSKAREIRQCQLGISNAQAAARQEPLAPELVSKSSCTSKLAAQSKQLAREPYSAHVCMTELEERQRKNRLYTKSASYTSSHPLFYNNDAPFRPILEAVPKHVLLSSFNSLVQNLYGGTTRNTTNTSATLSNLATSAVFEHFGQKQKASSPEDVRTLYKAFGLEPQTTLFACCPLPTCSAVYAPQPTTIPGESPYPLRCTNTKFGKQCKEPLTDGFCAAADSTSVPKPIKTFDYNQFHAHVGSMVARPGIEEAIRNHHDSGKFQAELQALSDIEMSPALQDLRDCSGDPFLAPSGDELRLVWALCVDWYNPHSNKAAGKSVSSGVIAMVCLSLPPELRNLEENIYLSGVIPGPQEPSVDATNHFLSPLINDLAVSYTRGVYYSQTYLYPSGRISRSAIVPVIADTIASKKVTGNCGHAGKYFCSRCRLTRDAISNLDPSSWLPGLTRVQHERLAVAWAQSKSKSVQDTHLKQNGIRWSVLLRLPYWQPAAWTVTEAVHVVLLGVVPRHCRDLLGLNIKELSTADNSFDDQVSEEELIGARRALQAPIVIKKVRSLKVRVLQALCFEQGISLPATKKRRTKKEYIAALLGSSHLTQGRPIQDDDLSLPLLFDELQVSPEESSPDPSHINVAPTTNRPTLGANNAQPLEPIHNPLSRQDLLKICEGIASTQRPRWQAHLPETFGSPEHGKLKADQWRTALEFDIPVSLVEIQTLRRPSNVVADDARLQKLVDATMDLAIAIAWGLSRRTSSHHAERYMFYMRRYLSAIQTLFPDYDLKPVHHYALHIPDLLLLFGPLHGTWAFSTERLIGRLQKLNTNSKIDELERTALSMFCMRGSFAHLMASPRCPDVLKSSWSEVAPVLRLPDLESKLHHSPAGPSNLSKKPQVLPLDIQQALAAHLSLILCPPDPASLNTSLAFTCQQYFSESGIAFAAFSHSTPHSLIYYKRATPSGQLVPAQIRLIFQHFRKIGRSFVGEIFAALHEFAPKESIDNPFAKYPDFRAKIYDREPRSSVHVVQIASLHCHANQRPWGGDAVVMRAIDRHY